MTERTLSMNVEQIDLKTFDADNFSLLESLITDATNQLPVGHMYLDSHHLKGLAAKEGIHGVFSLDRVFEAGRQRSRRQVKFGNLALSSALDQTTSNFVAVKPFKPDADLRGRTPAEALAHEWVANERVARLGTLRWTFEPLGIWKVKSNDTPSLLTKFESPVTSADNTFWVAGDKAKDVSDGQIKTALDRGFFSLGLLHAAGFAHGDAQVKNIGHHPERLRFLDLEWLKLLKVVDGLVVPNEENAQAVHGDLNVFIRSTIDTRQAGNDMVTRVAPLIINTDPKVFRSSYLQGTHEGAKRSGNKLSPRLIYTPKKLHDTILTNLALQHTYNQSYTGNNGIYG